MKTKLFALFVAILLVGGMILPSASYAITVSPPIIDLEANRGDVIEQTIKVRNESDKPATYYLSVERFIAGNEAGEPSFVGEDVGLATWINFPVESITIAPGATVPVTFNIAVPNYAAPGGQYAGIFLSTLPPSGKVGASQVQIASRIVTLLLVRIAGEINEGAKLSEFNAAADTFDALPANFNIRVENTGNVHVKPMGTVLIKNMFGSIAGSVAVNEAGGNVLPSSTRKFDASWVKNPNAIGATTFWGKYQQQKENYAFGKYTAELNLNYGTAGKVLYGKTTFWVIPWNVLIVNLVILVLIIVLIYLIVMKYNSWLIKKFQKAQKKVVSVKK